MTPSQVYQELPYILAANLVPFIHGAPGIGKSTVVADYARDHELQLEDLRASQLDPVDARGVPVINHDKRATSWFPPDFLPRSGRGILFLDELNKANQDTQAALYQLILDGRVGNYELPKGWHIVAAGNRDEDGSMVQPMARALKNRFVHLTMEVDYDDFIDYAHRNHFDERVIAFIRFSRTSLDEFGDALAKDKNKRISALKASNAFATPRSWEFVSRFLQVALTKERTLRDCYNVLEGTVGEGKAMEFVSYCEIYLELPDLDELIKRPKSFKPTENTGHLYAICTGLAARAKKSTFTAIGEILKQIPPEFAMMCIDDCLRRDPSLGEHEAYLDWVYNNIELSA